jgi:hypothetical protein
MIDVSQVNHHFVVSGQHVSQNAAQKIRLIPKHNATVAGENGNPLGRPLFDLQVHAPSLLLKWRQAV